MQKDNSNNTISDLLDEKFNLSEAGRLKIQIDNKTLSVLKVVFDERSAKFITLVYDEQKKAIFSYEVENI